MFRKACLLGAASCGALLAATGYAHADPITFLIGSAITSAAIAIPGGVAVLGFLFPAGASAAAIGSAALSAALTAASIAASFIRPKVRTKAIKQTSQGAEGPGIYAFGRVEIEGRILFGNTSGFFLSRWIGHAFGPLDGIEAHFYDGREITVEPDGYVSTPPWARPPGHPRPSYMNVKTKVGDGTETTPASLLTDFPSTITSAHRNRGIAASVLRIESPGVASPRFGRLLQGGIKGYRQRDRLGHFYDPRNATTVWTLNGVLHVLHFMRLLGGLRDADIDFDLMADAADAGEVAISGGVPRCQLSGGWEGPLTTDIIEDMMESAGIEEYQSDDAKIALRFIEDWPEPEIAFRARHIIDNYPQSGPESGRRPNICKVSYFSPERRYEKAELDMTGIAWARIEDEITAYGDQEMNVDLTFCCNHIQACMIARRLFYMARADFGMLKLNFAGMAAWGKRTGIIPIPDVGTDGASIHVKVRFGAVRPNDAEGTVEIPYQIIPDILSVAFNPATDAAPAPPLLVPQLVESDLPTPGTPTEAVQVVYPDTSREVRVAFPSASGGGVTVEAVYRVYLAGSPQAGASMTEVATPSYAYAAADLEGDRVDFRVRVFNVDGDSSYFSALFLVDPVAIDNTATAAPTQSVTGNNGDWDVETTAPIDLNVAYVQIEKSSPATGGVYAVASTQHARPSGLYTLNITDTLLATQTILIRSRAFTSNGTPSAYSSVFSFTEPL